MISPSEKFIELVRIYSDGACKGNPGPAAVGIIIFDQDWFEIARFGKLIGSCTSNEAEYRALIFGLDEAAKYTRGRAECCVDSDIVEGQLSARYRLRDDKLRRLYHNVRDNERPFREVIYCRVSREDQRLSIAHKVANDALNGSFRSITKMG